MMFTFLKEMTDLVQESELNFAKKQLSYITEDAVSMVLELSEINITRIPLKFMGECLNSLQVLYENSSELSDFYSNIYNSPKINSVPATVALMDISEIKAIKPNYLIQFSKEMEKVLDKLAHYTQQLKEERNKIEAKKILDKLSGPVYCMNIKRQCVVSDIFGNDTENVLAEDNMHVYQINDNFITTILLPFINTMPKQLLAFDKMRVDIIKAVSKSADIINVYTRTLNRLRNEKKIDFRYVIPAIQSIHSIYYNVTSHIIACYMRMIKSYHYNLKEYFNQKQAFMQYYPEGINLMHESVSDGINDYLEEDIVSDLLKGKSDFLISVSSRIANNIRDYLERKSFDTEDDINMHEDSIPFNSKVYHASSTSLLEIARMLRNLKNDYKEDSEKPIQDIIKDAYLDCDFSKKFANLFLMIEDISYYNSYQDGNKILVINSIKKELLSAEDKLKEIGTMIEKIYNFIIKVHYDVDQNINNVFPNEERNRDMLEFLENLDREFREFVLLYGKSILKRFDQLEEEFQNIIGMNDKGQDMSLGNIIPDVTNYLGESESYVLEMMRKDHLNKLNNLYCEFVNKRNSFFTEDTNNGTQQQPTVQQSQPNSSNQTGNQKTNNGNNEEQGLQNTQNNTKPQVNDGNPESNSSASSTKVNIKERVSKFLKNLIQKFNSMISKAKDNPNWLRENKQALLSRKYTNVSVNILPYIDYNKTIAPLGFKMMEVFNGQALYTAIKSQKTDDELIKLLLPGAYNFLPKEGTTSERFLKYCKTGEAPLETVELKDGELGKKIPEMIAWVEKYYNGFAKELEKLDKQVQDILSKGEVVADEGLKGLSDEEKKNTTDNLTRLISMQSLFIGANVNACRDKTNDYMTVLRSLAPKQDKNNNQNQNEETQQTQETENK